MSMASWCKVFYPETVECVGRWTNRTALEHSLKKWIGLRSEHLKAHALYLVDAGRHTELHSERPFDEPLDLTGSSCALCEMHDSDCGLCPIAMVAMEADGSDELCHAEYRHFVDTHNPEPMIKLLRKARSWLRVNKRVRRRK